MARAHKVDSLNVKDLRAMFLQSSRTVPELSGQRSG